MAGMMAETYMLQAISNGLDQVRQNPEILDDILDALNENELAATKAYFGNANNKIFIAPGFPQQTNQLPFIGVTTADENQIVEQTPIGLEYYEGVDNNGNTVQYRGARFNGLLKATIYTPNADLLIWLSVVLKWSLLSQFDWFGSDEGGGMNNIQIGLGDYEPQPQFFPEFVFSRGVFLRAEYDQVFKGIPQLITSTQTTGNFQIE